MNYQVGDIVYLIESNRFIREVKIAQISSGMCLVKFTDTPGGIRVRQSRLYENEQSAQAALDQITKTHTNQTSRPRTGTNGQLY